MTKSVNYDAWKIVEAGDSATYFVTGIGNDGEGFVEIDGHQLMFKIFAWDRPNRIVSQMIRVINETTRRHGCSAEVGRSHPGDMAELVVRATQTVQVALRTGYNVTWVRTTRLAEACH